MERKGGACGGVTRVFIQGSRVSLPRCAGVSSSH